MTSLSVKDSPRRLFFGLGVVVASAATGSWCRRQGCKFTSRQHFDAAMLSALFITLRALTK